MVTREYKCTECGIEKNYEERISDPIRKECPACGSRGLVRMLTNGAFRLKGLGWPGRDMKLERGK